MSADLIDGKAVAADIRENVAAAVADLQSKHGYAPTLAVILVGQDPASQVYVRSKHKFTREAGMHSREHKLPANTPQDDIIALVKSLNADEAVDGILVQLPLPGGLDGDAVIAHIDPAKDVDGLTETSAGRLSLGRSGLRPCTPFGSVVLAKQVLAARGEELSGKHCCHNKGNADSQSISQQQKCTTRRICLIAGHE